MKKSLIALLLVVALVVTVSVFAVSAENSKPFEGKTGTVNAYCQACKANVDWLELASNSSPIPAGHHYLSKNTSRNSGTTLSTEAKVCLDLNGFQLTRTRYTTGLVSLEHEKAEFNLFDSVGGGSYFLPDMNAEATPAEFKVAIVTVKNGTFNQYGGALNRAMDRAILTNGSCVRMYGGTYNMFGGSMTGKTSYAGGAVHVDAGTFNMENGTIHGVTTGNGGAIAIQNGGTVDISGGTVTGTATNGGCVYIAQNKSGGTSTARFILRGTGSLGSEDFQSTASAAGALLYPQGNCVVEIKGGTLQNGQAPNGGAVVGNSSTVDFSMTGGTIKNCSATTAGGAFNYSAGMVTNITGGKIENCTAPNGGAFMVNGTYAATVNFGGTAEISKCTATTNGAAAYVQKGTFNMKGGTIKECDATGSGGALYLSHSTSTFTMTGGTIEDCSAASGGALYIQFLSAQNTISGGTIQNCTAKYGGNILITGTGPKLTVSGTAKIKDGTATSVGGNVSVTGSETGIGTFVMNGGTVSGGKSGTDACGGNISLNAVSAATAGDSTRSVFIMNGGELDATGSTGKGGRNIYIESGTATINGGTVKGIISDTIRMNNSAGAVLNLNGGNFPYSKETDPGTWARLFTIGLPATASNVINIGADFTGKLACDYWAGSGDNDTAYAVGTVLKNFVLADGYNADNLQFYVYDQTISRKPVAVNADNKLEIVGYVGVDANGAEHAITAMPTDDTYAYIKLYGLGMTIELTQDVVVDVNNMDAYFVTGDNKLTVVNYRNSDTTVNVKDKFFTVDKAENLVNLTVAGRNPVSKAQYIIIPEADNKYSAHQVKVDINMVSVRPKTASMYYTTTIAANAKVAPYAKSYGVILSLVDMPDANFLNDDSNQDGQIDNIRTKIDLNETAAFTSETNSALLTGILTQGAATNNEYGQMKVYANAYVCVNINGTDCYIMADETADYSLKDIMEKVNADEELAANASVIEMYKTWSDPLATWGLDNIAANAATAA